MTFFFDNTFPPQIAEIIKIMEVDALHLQDLFDARVDDVDWTPRAGQEGWIVITGDLGIHKKPAERLKLEEANIVTVFLHEGFTKQKIWEQLSFTPRNADRLSGATAEPDHRHDLRRGRKRALIYDRAPRALPIVHRP